MRVINIARTQAKGLLKMMSNAGAPIITTKMIHGIRADFSSSLYAVTEDGRCIYEKESKRLVDIVKN
ncbi:hypothetical protein KDD93_03480 [Campylobacter sp. faydin G-24]|uniref:Uncharacterized protein n=1 Tax=Campylobacter anatolicus TaxID=2829105 RepID=A0ABS5HH87_9BACT|nr:hypothetical protein [Campylobacter anatolicus]MBR8463634.1 hypothetical protein [Campylobacter anatolicus]